MKSKHGGVWVSAKDAAKLLGRSERSVLRRYEQGYIRRDAGRREPGASIATPLYSVDDIEALLAGTPNYYPPDGSSAAPMRITAASTVYALPAPAATTAEETGDGDAALDHSRPWLTLAQAAEYSGLPASYLAWAAGREVFEALDVGIRPGGRWRFHRDSLANAPGEIAPL